VGEHLVTRAEPRHRLDLPGHIAPEATVLAGGFSIDLTPSRDARQTISSSSSSRWT
jgi:hypothetical protein